MAQFIIYISFWFAKEEEFCEYKSFISKFWGSSSALAVSRTALPMLSTMVSGTPEKVTEPCLALGDMLTALRSVSSQQLHSRHRAIGRVGLEGAILAVLGSGHLEVDIELLRKRKNHGESERIRENVRGEESEADRAG